TGVAYHVEHIVPKVRGGADTPANYALACVTCNGHKSDHITGTDPRTSGEVALFNPRRDRWERHFRFSPGTLEIHGITAKGRATVARLQMNERKQIEARTLWVQLEIFP
ncbi:MAG: HNH endonuclease, partial [Chthoniobacteraceae bacterium]